VSDVRRGASVFDRGPYVAAVVRLRRLSRRAFVAMDLDELAHLDLDERRPTRL
jgi:hypothetical protein